MSRPPSSYRADLRLNWYRPGTSHLHLHLGCIDVPTPLQSLQCYTGSTGRPAIPRGSLLSRGSPSILLLCRNFSRVASRVPELCVVPRLMHHALVEKNLSNYRCLWRLIIGRTQRRISLLTIVRHCRMPFASTVLLFLGNPLAFADISCALVIPSFVTVCAPSPRLG